MEIKETYEREINYIGASPSHWNKTDWISKRYGFINYTSYIHDKLYSIMLREETIFNKLVLKMCFDLVFLVLGVCRGIKKFQLLGLMPLIILFIILIVSTPYYLYKKQLEIN